MTALMLSMWIASAIAMELMAYAGVVLWRHWRDFQLLRLRAAELGVPPATGGPEEGETAVASAWQGYRTFKVARRVVEDAAGSICSFHLVPEDERPLPAFEPGQFLTFRLDVPSAAGGDERIVRCYSLSDAPRPDHYRVSIKRMSAPSGSGLPPGRSSNYFHDHVEVGSLLQVRSPSGHFHPDRGDSPVVLIGGGIGITPLLSMLNWCLAEQPGREVWLFYAVRSGRELAMRGHLETQAAAHPNFHLCLCFGDPLPGEVPGRDFHHQGFVDVGLLRARLPLRPYHFYVCGPTPMMESLVPALEEWGVPDSRIHFEAFGPASIRRKNGAPTAVVALSAPTALDAGIVVSFTRSGKQLPWSPTSASLLEFAEASGIVVPSGCRAGGCGTCQTTISSGEVAYRQPPDYDPEPGTCLLCMCVPRTSLALEA